MISTDCPCWVLDQCVRKGGCLNDRPGVVFFYSCPVSEERKKKEEAEFQANVKAANEKAKV